MAEAYLRSFSQDHFMVASAGSDPSGYVHPLSLKALEEDHLVLENPRSKPLTEFLDQEVETVITVCGNADQACPVFPGQVKRYHWPFDDPAHAEGSEKEQMVFFRQVRNELKAVFGAYASGRIDGANQASS